MATTPPIALRDRVELASDGWLAEADRYLKRRLAEGGDAVADADCSVCEVYTGAPPHLGLPDDVATIVMRIKGNNAQFARGDVDDVDFKATADYNQALEMAMTVYGGDPDRRSRAEWEQACRHGPDAFQVKGQLDPPPVLARILGDLHDHMARRTVPNPDLDHRICHLGLARHREELDTKGYTVLERAVSEDFVDEVKNTLVRAIEETPGPVAARLIERGRIFQEAAQHPWVLALAEHVVGRGCLLLTSLGLRKEPGQVTHSIHVDYPSIPEPFPAYCMVSTSIWALEDFDDAAGPTLIVPGSFKHNRSPIKDEGNDELVPIHMPKGSIAMWNGASWHSSQVRTAPSDRVTLHNTYCRMFMRPMDGYLEIDPSILEANSPQITTLCGLDDIFEKGRYDGHFSPLSRVD